MTIIVDTNVAVVANGKSEQASEACVDTCIGRLEQIIRGEIKLILDAKRIILDEYLRNLSSSGQPGTGDRFLRWVLINQGTQCELVPITPIKGSKTEFKEFPADPALKGFDPDDQKFVAVAYKHPEKPPILQAVDSGWWDFREALCRYGVTVEFICEDDIRRMREGV